jgi:hypothetical protein
MLIEYRCSELAGWSGCTGLFGITNTIGVRTGHSDNALRRLQPHGYGMVCGVFTFCCEERGSKTITNECIESTKRKGST